MKISSELFGAYFFKWLENFESKYILLRMTNSLLSKDLRFKAVNNDCKKEHLKV